MMNVYDEMVKEWPHAKAEWLKNDDLISGRRVWLLCKKYVEKMRIKYRDVRDAGIQMMNFKQLKRSERIKEQGKKRKYEEVAEDE